MKAFNQITFDPGVMGGKPCIRGLRVTVGMVLGPMAVGRSPDEILKAYPYLDPGDFDQALVVVDESKCRVRILPIGGV